MTVPFFHDKQRNLLVYDTPEPEAITRYVQGAVHLHNGYVAVPISLYNLQLLRWLNFPVIPVMNGGYDWPHGPQIDLPFRAQIITANFLAVHPRAFVLSEMRTGKTLSVLWAADYLMTQHAPGTFRFIINAPLSILQRVWGDQIFRHFMGRRTYGILHGTEQQRLRVLAEPHDFYIINHDGVGVGAKDKSNGRRKTLELTGFAAALAARTDIRGAVIDEISAYRNGTTRRHRVARALLQGRAVFWGLSGTPTPNGPTDAHAQARLVNDAFGESFRAYQQRVMFQLGQFKWVPRRGAHVEARKLLSPSIRFEMKDCTDVPPKLPPQLLDVELSKAQQKAYGELKREAVLTLDSGGTITAANEAVLRSKLIQIACGAIYETKGDERIVHEIDAAPRMAACMEMVEQAGDKIIILAPLTSVLGLLHKKLTAKQADGSPLYTCEVINGAVPRKKRDEILQRFQETDALQILLADPGTLSHGLDLSVAKVILWYALPEKTEQYLQANERIRGPNQKYPTLIAQLAATAPEREIFRRLEANESLQGVMLALVRGDDHAVYRSAALPTIPRAA